MQCFGKFEFYIGMLECEALTGSKLMDIIEFSSASTVFRAVEFFCKTA